MSFDSPFHFIDIFSGAGGLSAGLELSGATCLLGVDHDKHAIKTFAHNHPHAATFSRPVQELDQKKIQELTQGKKIHAVVGGPPCQGFSTVGKGDPSDIRNTLFRQFCRIVKDVQPDFVVMENVTGLLAKKNEKVLQGIISTFKKLGLNLQVRVLEAQHYGVAERRKRTIFIGSRFHQEIVFPKMKESLVTVGSVLSNLKNERGIIFNHDIDLAKVKNKLDFRRIQCIPEGKGVRYQEDEEMYWPKSLHLGIDWKKLPENRFRQTKYLRLDRSKLSPTIMTNAYNYFHPCEHRYLTLREAAAIQSFPNGFEFLGPISSQWRQVGNAVPPLLGLAIGEALKVMTKTLHLGPQENQKNHRNKLIKNEIHRIRGEAFVY